MNNKVILLLGIISGTYMSLNAQDIVINEIMQSNIDCYLSEHDFSDSWVELRNTTDQSIDLYHYRLGTSADFISAYEFSRHDIIDAHGYRIVSCDKKNAGLHTTFRLESTNAGKLYLFNSTGEVLHKLDYPAMPAANIAYGCLDDDQDVWGWEITPTPSARNQGAHATNLLPNPKFSIQGKVTTKAVNVTVSVPTSGCPTDTKVYVTTDGTEPTLTSDNGTSLSFSIKQSTVLRAKLISSEALSRPSLTQSYIFHPRSTTLPIISIATNDAYLYSAEDGIFSSEKTVLGDDAYLYEDGLLDEADAQTTGISNYWFDWRRPFNVEYLNGTAENLYFNQIGEMGISGVGSRAASQKSMKMFANKRFGTKKYNGVIWSEKPYVTKTKSFILRNGGSCNDGARINDALLHRIFGKHVSTIDYQAYRPAIVYINGIYKGEYGMRERSNEDYVESNYGIEDEDIEMADHTSYIYPEYRSENFAKFYDLYTSSSTTYQQLDAVMDIESFKQTLIAEMFSKNLDYPQNNVSMWRENSSTGKWKWILKDVDFFGRDYRSANIDFDMFKYMFGCDNKAGNETEYKYSHYAITTKAMPLYLKMGALPKFKESFIDSYATYLGDFLKPSVTLAELEIMAKEIEEEINYTFPLYSQNISDFYYYLDVLRDYCKRYPAIVYKQMANYYSLGKVVNMTVQTNGAKVKINDVGLTEGNFDGAYFSKRALRLSSGFNNKGWKLITYHYSSTKGTMVKLKEQTYSNPNIEITIGEISSTADSIAFSTYSIEQSAFERQIQSLGISSNNLSDLSNDASIVVAEPQYAYVNIFNVDALPNTKSDNLKAYLDFYDNNGHFFRKKVLLNLQGNGDAIKKNLSIEFCEDDWVGEITTPIQIGDWVSQDEFHLKAFYEDGLRGTAEVAYQVYSKITQRSNGYPKAFPMSLYINGDFYGIMSWQLKKHRDNMGLDKKDATNVWIDGTINDKQIFQKTINWSKFEVRNPKDLYNIDGTLYDGDSPKELIDEKSAAYDASKAKMVRTAQAKAYIQNLSKRCPYLQTLVDNKASTSTVKKNMEKNFDVPELINYLVFSLVTNNYDGFSKNWQWFTLDGVKWTVAPYDCNLTFGYNEEGLSLWPATQSSKKYDYKMENVDTEGPLYWLKQYYWTDVKNRYATLRKNGTISPSAIMTLVTKWKDRIGDENYKLEWKKWSSSPCVTNFTDSPERFREWITNRIALLDVYLDYQAATTSYSFALDDSNWATICVPFSFSIPDGLEVYSVTGVNADGINLMIEKVTDPEANKPYVIHGPKGQYSISGEISSDYSTLNNGLLSGVLINTFAPAETYVLQCLNGVTGFYHVSQEGSMPLAAYHAYLTTEENAKLGHYRLSLNDSSINTVECQSDENTYYNGWGNTIKSTETSGFYIKRMPDGSCRKEYK